MFSLFTSDDPHRLSVETRELEAVEFLIIGVAVIFQEADSNLLTEYHTFGVMSVVHPGGIPAP